MRRTRFVLVLVTAIALAAGQWANAAGTSARSGASSARQAPRGHFQPLALEGAGTARKQHDSTARTLSDGDSSSEIECRSFNATRAPNLRLDCDSILPNNEPHIAVDPANPLHMVGSSNDYDQCCDAFYTTFNGGKSWYVGNMSVEAPGQKGRTGSDPVTSFDRKHGTVIHASLNFLNNGCDGDVVASVSEDGGKKWNTIVEVASGGGCDNPFNDKEWITTDNNPASPHYGTSYITWTAFFGSSKESHEGGEGDASLQDEIPPQSPIYEAHSTDGGYTWSTPQEISGTNPALCTYELAERTGACNDDQFSVPSIAPDGTVYVTFINDQNMALWEPDERFDDQYLMVQSNDGGLTWTPPSFVVGLEDGSRDMPINVNGRQTLTNQQLRSPFTQGFVADPTSNGRLYLTFDDNRNGVHDSDNPKTETDVFIMVKPNAASPWTGPINVNSPDNGQIGNDQWFPAVDVNPTNGNVGVLFNDRKYTTHFRPHGVTYAVSTNHGATFVEHRASTALSHTRNSVFFRAFAPGCKTCTRFHGDYISMAYGSDGKANLVWTDMRDFFDPLGRYLQFIYYARR